MSGKVLPDLNCKRIGITGSNGFLAYHVRVKLHVLGAQQVVLADRSTFADASALANFVKSCDVILHLAAVNRSDVLDVEAENIAMANALVAAMRQSGCNPDIAYSSSTHVDRSTPYGRGKKAAGTALAEHCKRVGSSFGEFVFPHIFGEFSKPFYNSVVATFCYQVAHAETPQIHQDSMLNLVHAQKVADLFVDFIRAPSTFSQRVDGTQVMVSDVLALLRKIDQDYRLNIFPATNDPFVKDIFNTYRSFLFPHFYPLALKLHEDARGALFEAVKERGPGQAFVSSSYKEVIRGNHFHLHKVERFLVLSGSARISLRRLFSEDVIAFDVTGDTPAVIDIPTFYTHNIANTGNSSLVTLFWADELFDPNRPDTYSEAV